MWVKKLCCLHILVLFFTCHYPLYIRWNSWSIHSTSIAQFYIALSQHICSLVSDYSKQQNQGQLQSFHSGNTKWSEWCSHGSVKDLYSRDLLLCYVSSYVNSLFYLFLQLWLGMLCWDYSTAAPSTSTSGWHSWQCLKRSLPLEQSDELKQQQLFNLTFLVMKRGICHC